MKNKNNRNLIIGIAAMLILAAVFILIVIRHEKSNKTVIPFSTLGWDSSYEDMTEAEGNLFITYTSSGGTTYQYIKEYLGKTGYLKYHFGDDGTLLGIAWACEARDKEELEKLYNGISSELTAKYGEGISKSSGLNHSWNTSDNTGIHLNTGFGGKDFSLQYFFINPKVSDIYK